jgi:hypothetical protein
MITCYLCGKRMILFLTVAATAMPKKRYHLCLQCGQADFKQLRKLMRETNERNKHH